MKIPTKYKVFAILLALLIAFGGGVWSGYQIPRTDPQYEIETVFTPYEDGTAKYLEFLDRARESVYIAAFTFTDDRITDKLIELKTRRGVKEIHLLIDLSQADESWSGDDIQAQVRRLRHAGIEVVYGTSEKSKAIMHMKYTIIDGIWVEDGSFNYTKLAGRQANVLNFVKSPMRAKLFLENWQRMHAFMKAQNLEPDPPAPPKKSK